MKLHDLKPPPGSQRRRIRVGRGIAAGRGKTAGRGTKGQKSRSGASVPGWFEGGQTPIHVRVPKLRGFRNINRIDYQVVNVGRISEYAAAGRFGSDAGSEPITVNAAVLATAGLIAHADRPLKVLGDGDLEVKVFVAADAFTKSAKSKIEDAGGFVQLLAPEPEPEPAETAPEPEAPAGAAVAEVEEPVEEETTAQAPAEEPQGDAASAEDIETTAGTDVSDEPTAE